VQDPEKLKKSRPAEYQGGNYTKNIWFVHDEQESILDNLEKRRDFSPALSLSNYNKFEPIARLANISPQNQQGLVDYLSHQKVLSPRNIVDFNMTSPTKVRNQNFK